MTIITKLKCGPIGPFPWQPASVGFKSYLGREDQMCKWQKEHFSICLNRSHSLFGGEETLSPSLSLWWWLISPSVIRSSITPPPSYFPWAFLAGLSDRPGIRAGPGHAATSLSVSTIAVFKQLTGTLAEHLCYLLTIAELVRGTNVPLWDAALKNDFKKKTSFSIVKRKGHVTASIYCNF